MNEEFPKNVEKYRNTKGFMTSNEGDNFGLFYIRKLPGKPPLKVLCSQLGENDWDHVSVSLPNRCPTWSEMCLVKDLFFSKKEMVVQFHPKEEDYINNHKTCLHLWKYNLGDLPKPNKITVGI